MTKKNFNTYEIKDLDGKVVKENDKVVTAKSLAVGALLNMRQSEENVEGNVRAERYALAMKIHTAKEEVDLKPEELALIKELAGKMYTPLPVGRLYEFLDK